MTPLDIFGSNILIVDDQRANVQLLEQLLNAAGYTRVIATTNPQEVCELHRQNNFDLILLDLHMPVMDGFQVMEGLKVDADNYLPVIVLTAQPNHKLRALQLGAKDFISKPFDVAEVKTRIYNMLEVRLLYKRLESYNRQLKQQVLEREHIEEQLRNTDRRKDEFLAMLAHELRNPLAPISAAAALLSMGDLDDAQVKKTSQIISRQVNHMSSLVDDLLDISRVSWGMVTLNKEVLDTKRVVSETVEQVSELMSSRRHHLSVHMPPDAAFVLGDHKRLVQVMTNLLNNAAKYTPEGGTIVLRLDVDDEFVTLSVTDNGIGMTAELVEHAFELFAQAVRTSDRFQGGLGLGLALVKSLVDLHQGEVTVTCAGLNLGSQFTVRLPRVAAVSAPAIVPPEDLMLISDSGLLVMVVDDNIDGAHVLAMLLEASGYQVFEEHESKKALERASIALPDVCLLDIGLPDMDGYELARRLRAQPGMANTTIIAVTGYGDERGRKEATAAGFDYHFTKPIDIARLFALLAEISDAKCHKATAN